MGERNGGFLELHLENGINGRDLYDEREKFFVAIFS